MAQRLTPMFLQQLLSSDEPNLCVTQVLVNPGSGRGDNYTAMLYRVDVKGFISTGDLHDQGKEWERPLIYKCLPASTERRQAYRSDVLFSNEVAFYTQALPALQSFQLSRGVADGFNAVPRCYTARQDLLLLEDLRVRGFIMLDRKAGLDVVQCRAVLSELAKFHALSLAMKTQQPELFERNVTATVREALFVPENEAWYKDYYAAACRSALASIQEFLPQKYADKFETFTKGFFTRMTNLVSQTYAGNLNQPIALCHGDCWTNNILFRVNQTSGEILEVCLLDFQLARIGSPALDLANLLYCCTTRELRVLHLESLILHYHQQLDTSLRQLGSVDAKEMTLDSLQCEMNKYASFGLGLALDMIPISTCESNEAPDLYNLSNQDIAATQAGCELLDAPPTLEGKRRMAELVQELVDQQLI